MAQLEEWFKRIPWFEDYYSINIDWKVASYLKLCWPKKWWQLQEHPASFLKWQQWVWRRARNTLTVQLHKDWKRIKVAIAPTVKKLFGVKRFLYERKKKPKYEWMIVIQPKDNLYRY